ncbi:hypothetical protein [Polyangium spumosum]|uniref:Lipoprotein n=1 Tax=Polyangium spumosum TaxID=889282 RepID=A0A6N7Q729_9BACT|nr:hypothetical protein [Polyangium spumosum]MRG98525.1 hypothetical protein [Polyangium spumosum]
MNSNQNTLSFVALALALALPFAACSGEGGGNGDATGSGGASSSATSSAGGFGGSGGSGGAGGAGGGGQVHTDLFACGVTTDCPQMSIHLSPEPEQALVCAAKLIVSSAPGALSALEVPGPNFTQTERLIVLQGDGKALVQSRHRACEIGSCPPEPIPWEPSSAHQICDVVLGDDVAAGCAAMDDMTCRWSPWGPGKLENCVEVEDWGCDDVAALL